MTNRAHGENRPVSDALPEGGLGGGNGGPRQRARPEHRCVPKRPALGVNKANKLLTAFAYLLAQMTTRGRLELQEQIDDDDFGWALDQVTRYCNECWEYFDEERRAWRETEQDGPQNR